MQKHCENALQVAQFLDKHPKIKKVFYPHLPSHKQFDLAKKYLNESYIRHKFGSIFKLEISKKEVDLTIINFHP